MITAAMGLVAVGATVAVGCKFSRGRGFGHIAKFCFPMPRDFSYLLDIAPFLDIWLNIVPLCPNFYLYLLA